MEFENTTIVRYLMGWNDDPMMRREDFLNPTVELDKLCNYCGRKCACGSQIKLSTLQTSQKF